MINFSVFFPDSGGWVTVVGLGLSFAGSGFAAQMSPRPKKITSEIVKKIRISLLQFDFMVSSKPKRFLPHPLIV
jgi:hypothetical protein